MRSVFAGLMAVVLAGCAGPRIPGESGGLGRVSEAGAVRVMAEARDAAGGAAFRAIETIEISYAGEWSGFATKLQPVLSDPAYRRTSQEWVEAGGRGIVQEHRGPGGSKLVVRGADSIAIGRGCCRRGR